MTSSSRAHEQPVATAGAAHTGRLRSGQRGVRARGGPAPRQRYERRVHDLRLPRAAARSARRDAAAGSRRSPRPRRAASVAPVGGGWITLTTLLATAMVVAPAAWPTPQPESLIVLLVVAGSLAGTLRLALRHLRLYRLGRHLSSLAAAFGFAYLGLSMLVFLTATPFGLGVWSAHLVDAFGAYAATIGLALSGRRNRSTALLLAPVVNRDPLAALELGLVPDVHRYLALLETKDAITRDHMVRVGELAMRLGVRAGLSPARLRVLGLGALLHDIGKLAIPEDVLKKPGALTAAEFRLIQHHTEAGAEIMESSPVLAPAAPLVRWHHERPDGRGYPDGLVGDAISVDVAIVSAVDAFDAMTQARPYRGPMSVETALEIVRRESGTQFDPGAVALLERELQERGPVPLGTFGGDSMKQGRSRGNVPGTGKHPRSFGLARPRGHAPPLAGGERAAHGRPRWSTGATTARANDGVASPGVSARPVRASLSRLVSVMGGS